MKSYTTVDGKLTSIEIWPRHYLNHPEQRSEEDKTAKIIQIERGSSEGDYIVELVK